MHRKISATSAHYIETQEFCEDQSMSEQIVFTCTVIRSTFHGSQSTKACILVSSIPRRGRVGRDIICEYKVCAFTFINDRVTVYGRRWMLICSSGNVQAVRRTAHFPKGYLHNNIHDRRVQRSASPVCHNMKSICFNSKSVNTYKNAVIMSDPI
jgi:hypothetical protein